MIVAVCILIAGILLLNRFRSEPEPSVPSDAADPVQTDVAVEQPVETVAPGSDPAADPADTTTTDRSVSNAPTPAAPTAASPAGASSDPVGAPVDSPGVGFTTDDDPNRLSGRVSLLGTPPAELALPLDPQCARTVPAGARPTTRFYVTDADGRLADTLVYLVDAPEGDYPPPGEPLVLDQVACEYIPYIAAARTNQLILVKNSDPLMHNVHVTPAPESGNPQSNRVQMPNGADLEFRFPDEELFLRFKCDVHPWMFTYVSILRHPYFAVSDAGGNWSMPLPPPGDYTLEAVHRRAGSRQVSVTVTETGVSGDLHFRLETP